MMIEPPFTRELDANSPPGIDIEGIGRALARADVGYVSLKQFNLMPLKWRRTYGIGKQRAVNVIRKREKRTQNGRYDVGVHGMLVDMQAFDANATNKMILWNPPVAYCYPIAKNFPAWVCQGLHETGGIPGNWAIDFCVPEIGGNGAPILAVEDAWVYRLSGKDPNQDRPNAIGSFGWSVYLQTRSWIIYYYTHLGSRAPLVVGQKLAAGTMIGRVGDQAYRPDHVHAGCTHPLGERAAREHIEKIARSARVVARQPTEGV